MTLLKRGFAEHKAVAVPLLAALAINIGAYLLVVRPLASKSAGAAGRALASRAALAAADADFNATQGLVVGKARAEEELSTFYQKVVPPDLSAARRMTYIALPALARKANVKWDHRRFSVEPLKQNTRLGHVKIQMLLEGEYENVRQFIYDLETAPEFVIVDDVTLTEGQQGKPLTVTLELSTYYRLGANVG